MAVRSDNLEGVIDTDKQLPAQLHIANRKFPEQEISNKVKLCIVFVERQML